MGWSSMCALLGFLSVHVAVVLDLVALGCNEWNSVEFKEDRVYFFTRGLFKQCDLHGCRYIQPSYSFVWFTAVQVAYTLGCVFVVTALLLYYAFFIYGPEIKRAYKLMLWILAINTMATVCVVVGVGVFGMEGTDFVVVTEGTAFEGTDTFGWTYVVAVLGAVFTAFTAAFVCRSAAIIRKQITEYEDI